MANGPPPREEQQRLLRDARAKRDVFAEEKVRVENLLSSALEKVKLYQTLLGVTESKLCYVEDLIGSIRFRLQQRGFPTRTVTSLLPASDETTRNPENNRPSGTYQLSRFLIFTHMICSSDGELIPYRSTNHLVPVYIYIRNRSFLFPYPRPFSLPLLPLIRSPYYSHHGRQKEWKGPCAKPTTLCPHHHFCRPCDPAVESDSSLSHPDQTHAGETSTPRGGPRGYP